MAKVIITTDDGDVVEEITEATLPHATLSHSRLGAYATVDLGDLVYAAVRKARAIEDIPLGVGE